MMRDNRNKPKEFGAALTIVLNENELDIKTAIQETQKRYPDLYKAYCDELMKPYRDSLA